MQNFIAIGDATNTILRISPKSTDISPLAQRKAIRCMSQHKSGISFNVEDTIADLP